VDRRCRRLGPRVAGLPVPQPDRRSVSLFHAAGSDRWRVALARFDARGGLAPACGGIGVAALAAVFALGSAERSRLWRDETLLMLDAARHYPDGATAHYLAARRAANRGDGVAAVAELREAWARGLDRFMAFEQDPMLAGVRATPEFQALIRDMAGAWLDRARQRGHGTPGGCS
jgi:hypothetical protein